MGRVNQRIAPVTVEGLTIAGPGIDTGRARDLSGFGVFQHKQKPRRGILGADLSGKRRQGLLNLVGKSIALFRQGGGKAGTLGTRNGKNLVQIIRLRRTYQPHRNSLGRQFFNRRFETLEGFVDIRLGNDQ